MARLSLEKLAGRVPFLLRRRDTEVLGNDGGGRIGVVPRLVGKDDNDTSSSGRNGAAGDRRRAALV